jgi:hypothetical protein
MDNLTCETKVGDKIVEWLMKQPNVTILSYHPPSSKSYQGDLIRISKLTPDRIRTKNRYHVDIIFIKDDKLCLTELKCKLSESKADIEKLKEIERSYTLDALMEIISSRSSNNAILSTMKKLVKIIGVKQVDSELPDDFVVMSIEDDQLIINDNIKGSLL